MQFKEDSDLRLKRIVSALLAIVLFVGCLPLEGFAAESTRLDTPQVTVKNVIGSGRILLTWKAVEDAAGYKVYRASSKDGTYSCIGSIEAKKLTDTTAVSGKTYYYKVKAIAGKTGSNSKYSAVASGTYKLAQPELKVSGTSDGKVRLSWSKITGAKSYDLYRSTDKENWKLIKNTTDTSYTNASVTAGKTYYYRLQAIASREKANSAMSEIKSLAAPLAAPSIRVTTDAKSGKPVISWKAVEDAQRYEVFRASKQGGTYKSLGTTAKLRFTDDTAVGGKTYYYKATAISTEADAVSVKSGAKSVRCVLEPPTVSAKNNSAGKPVISWNDQEYAASYRIYRASSKTGEYKLLKTTTARKYTDTSVTAGKVFYYKVKAIGKDTSINSASSSPVSVACKLAKPVLKASNVSSTGKIKLSWGKVSGAQSYDLYRSTDKENWKLIKNVTGTSYTNASVTAGTTYYYQVQAIAAREAANSARSEIVGRTAKLAQPVAKVKYTDSGRVSLTWEACEGAEGYEVYRASSKTGEYKLLKSVTDTRLTDETGSAGKTYYYKVRALGKKTAANSAWSSVVSGTRKLNRPVVTAKNASNTGKIILSWDSMKNARKYEIYRSTSKDGTYKKIDSTTSFSYTDISVTAQKTYYYKVRAVGSTSAVTSLFSEPVRAVCKLIRPTVTLKNSGATGQVVVSWKAVTGAVGYDIYRCRTEDGTYKKIGTTTSLKFSDDTGTVGATYYYRVRALAKDEDATSAMSKPASAFRKLARPAISAEADKDSGKILLTWESVEGARFYDVYRATSKTGKYSLIKRAFFTDVTDNTTAAGKTYYYKVRACCDTEKLTSTFSDPESVVCTLSRAKVEAGNDAATGKVKLTWKAVRNARTYTVYRSTTKDGEYKLVKTTTSTSYTDTATYVGKTYYYKVRVLANTSAANAAYSKVVSATGKLARPSIKLGSVSDEGTFKITWSAVTGAKSYDLYRSTDLENWTLLESTTGRSHTTTTPESGVTYYFRLQAIASTEEANSAYSAEKYVYSKLSAPVISVSRDEALGRARITWEAVENAQRYAVYRSTTKTGTYSRLGNTENLSYLDPTGRAGQTYYYKVKALAFNSDANSGYSSAVSGSSRYVEDMNLSIQLNANGKPYLTWGQLKGIKEYRIYRSTQAKTGFEKISTTQYFSYTNNSVAEGVTYYYRVKAVNSNGAVVQTSKTMSIVPTLSQEEILQTRYINVPKVKLHTLPDNNAPELPLRYMDKIQLGNAVVSRDSGTWYRVYYQGELYYLLIKSMSTELTRKQSDFIYPANNKFQQRLINEALDLALNQKTVYKAGGNGDKNSKGAMGFDCSGMVSYLLNQTMRKWVPVYTVSSSMGVLSQTKNLYNAGRIGAFKAFKIERIEDLQPGDVLFFRSQLDDATSTDRGHCSIYLGNKEFIHCTSVWEDSVCIMPLTGVFEETLQEIRRFLPDTVTPAKESVRVTKACKVYERRNPDSPVLQSLARNAKVTILYITDRWAYVKTPAGNKGFVKAEYIPS